MVRELGVQGFIRFVRETIPGPWLGPIWVKRRLSAPFQLRLIEAVGLHARCDAGQGATNGEESYRKGECVFALFLRVGMGEKSRPIDQWCI